MTWCACLAAVGGLGAPASTAAVHAELGAQPRRSWTPRQALKERDEELARGRETSRRLMNQVKPLRG